MAPSHIVQFQSFQPTAGRPASSPLGTLAFEKVGEDGKPFEWADGDDRMIKVEFDGEAAQGAWRVSRRPWGYNAVYQTWLVSDAKELQVKAGVTYTLELEEREDGKGWRVVTVGRLGE
ncbi:hypothetical protein HDU93_005949 [Gonapodya sp. JEL0774]|nr:hypothetical protein HDU93_005949 [Gonapodya sp. JEL0774]